MNMKKENSKEKQYKLEPVVEILKYSKIKKGDILVLRCEKGRENEEITKMHGKLKMLLVEKDLRILAVAPDDKIEELSVIIESIKNHKDDI
jgi:hypothetical protein